MKEKIEEYILELDKEIEGLQELYGNDMKSKNSNLAIYNFAQIEAYDNVRNDLKSRLEELKYEGDE